MKRELEEAESLSPLSGGGVSHPDELRLQAYHDGELRGEACHQIQAHLGQCVPCAERIRQWGELGARLRQTRPAAEAFSSEGEFWARLAGRLPKARPVTWPLVPYLPPFLLGAFGLLTEGLISLVILAYALVGLGLIPPLAPTLRAWLVEALKAPFLESSLYAWLGWSGDELSQAVAQSLAKVSLATQEMALMLLIVLALGMFLSLLLIVYVSWALCWSKTGYDRSS